MRQNKDEWTISPQDHSHACWWLHTPSIWDSKSFLWPQEFPELGQTGQKCWEITFPCNQAWMGVDKYSLTENHLEKLPRRLSEMSSPWFSIGLLTPLSCSALKLITEINHWHLPTTSIGASILIVSSSLVIMWRLTPRILYYHLHWQSVYSLHKNQV